MAHLRSVARRHPLLLGFTLIYALTWPIDLALAAQSHGRLPFHMPEALGLLVGYGFVAAAIGASAMVGGGREVRALLRRYLVWRVGLVWYVVVLAGPVVLVLVSLAIDVWLGAPPPDFSRPFVRKLIPAGPSLWVIAPIWLVFETLTNGEEIGWRGYALPRLLARHNALVASLILGPIWALWHLPKFLLGGTVGSAHDYPLWIFVVGIMGFTLLLTWVFVHTEGSLLLATLFHAASNTAVLCLPVLPGGRAFLIMLGLQCFLALIVVLVAGPELAAPPTATVLFNATPENITEKER